jgi:micrococcal nuclease
MVVLRASPLPFLTLAAFAPAAHATALTGPVAASVERVVDGDTVKVLAEIWVDQHVAVSVRLKNVDAPELFRPQCEAERVRAREAKVFVEDVIGTTIVLFDIVHDKYGGRVVARVETENGADLGASLIAAGLAVPIGADDPWCD